MLKLISPSMGMTVNIEEKGKHVAVNCFPKNDKFDRIFAVLSGEYSVRETREGAFVYNESSLIPGFSLAREVASVLKAM